MKIEIKNRDGKTIYACEAESFREAVEKAVTAGADLAGANLAGAYLARANLARANLAGAYLAGAYLADADLAGANLARANLADADLAGAYLARANLADADLAGANLGGADLAGANLADAYLAGAYLGGAYLAGADLAGAYLGGAYLADAYLAGAIGLDPSAPASTLASAPQRRPYERHVRSRQERMLEYRARHPDVPVVDGLDGRILNAIESGVVNLDMAAWHCGATHCRAGLAVHLAGEAGYALEAKVGNPGIAGRMIYRASTGRSPWFFDTNKGALADIRRCAKEESTGA